VYLTSRRLVAIGLSPSFSLLVFVPWVHLIFFSVLSAVPSNPDAGRDPAERHASFARLLPEARGRSALVSVALSVLVHGTLVVVAAALLGSYGAGIFVGVPFAIGFLSSCLHGYREPRGLMECQAVAASAIVVLGLVLLIFMVEGIACLIMAAPIALALGALGGILGWMVSTDRHRRERIFLSCLVLLAVPGKIGIDLVAPPESPRIAVATTIEVDAPPERVWRHVVSFPPLAAPHEWLFRAGIACPVSATIDGSGEGAVRRCVFTTGTFVEPIEVWDPPRLLRFAVTDQPATLEEWNPFGEVEPAHLHGTFVSDRGEFRLEALPGGRTRLTGTTWYRNGMWPQGYWRLWSDAIVHRIHLRVLRHVEALAEAPGQV
jgi:hypothetical protein